MDEWAIDTPESLRQKAEQASRLASMTWDTSTHDALVLYAQELLARAEKMEAALEQANHRDSAA